MGKYNVLDDVILLNSQKCNLADADPLHNNVDVDLYPTKYFLREIFVMEKSDIAKCHTLKVYRNNDEFDLKITPENLARTLLAVSKEPYWAADYAKSLLKQFETNSLYVDWYNLVLNCKLEKGHYPKDWDKDAHKKYVLEYEEQVIYDTASGFKNEIILKAIVSGTISLFDRNHQQFSKYIAYQGIGHTWDPLWANYGVSFSYRRREIGYLTQMVS